MSGSKPWWFSGEEPPSSTFDLGGIASSAQQIIEWARDSLLTTHQAHLNPADHPTCLLCKAMQLFQQSPNASETHDDEPFTWIDLDPPK
ncbi:MAG: hypothetical protein PHN51_02105 [Candidatus Nanopelagicales bacterium]|nr:hypothetical protein [Candidatus Nanopelagicales bacterium]